jgi:hypothetical protein
MQIRVWLDDMRDAPPGWTRAYTAHEAIALLEARRVVELSLDHDLGDDEKFGTGYDVACWLEERVALDGFDPPSIKIHSANSVGRAPMQNHRQHREAPRSEGTRVTDVRFYLVIDLEATTSDDGSLPPDKMEVIEIGAVLAHARTFAVVDDDNRSFARCGIRFCTRSSPSGQQSPRRWSTVRLASPRPSPLCALGSSIAGTRSSSLHGAATTAFSSPATACCTACRTTCLSM